MLAERHGNATVLVDDGPLMDGWRPAVDEFVVRLRRLGVATTLLVTDCRSEAWHTGEAHRMLAARAAGTVVTVVHLMPQETWRQSVDTVEVTWRAGGARWAEEGLRGRTEASGWAAVPVIETGDGWLRRWARLVTGTGPVTLPALVTSPTYRPPAPGPPADLVAEFRASRTRTAFALAVRLAAAPLTDETVRAIRRSVPRATRSHLVEVLSSDLVRPVADAVPGGVRFEFVDGARERLLAFGHRDRTIAVQHLVEDALAGRVPAVRGLAGRVRDPHRSRWHAVDAADAPYRRVELTVHRALWCGR